MLKIRWIEPKHTRRWRPPQQGELLARLPWNVLVILDACRADYFCELAPGAEVVGSLGSIMWAWISRFADLVTLIGGPVLYVTANPVVNREMRRHAGAPICLLSVWSDRWGRHGPLNLPTVHPKDVVAAVCEYVDRYGQPARMVVHFVQPHVPFIGRRSIPYSGWGKGLNDALSREVTKLPHVKAALAEGLVTIAQVRTCYRDNLELVMEYRNELANSLRGLVVTTADHGELLGEWGLYGHTEGPAYPELRNVPWLQEDRGSFEPSDIPEHILKADPLIGDETISKKLAALGYM